jgi:hypothetical protein
MYKMVTAHAPIIATVLRTGQMVHHLDKCLRYRLVQGTFMCTHLAGMGQQQLPDIRVQQSGGEQPRVLGQ